MNQALVSIQTLVTALMLPPIVLMLLKFLKLFIWYMFDTPTSWWKKEIEKPRLLFFIFGILFILLSWKIFSISSDIYILPLKINAYWQIFLAIIINIMGVLILYGVWTKRFEDKLLPYIRKIILDEEVASPYRTGFDLENVLDQIKKLGYLECDFVTFQCLLSNKELLKEAKIKSSFSKRDLVRFLFVIFDIKENTKQDSIIQIVSHYFLDENGEPYNTSGIKSDISKVRDEILNNKKEYTELHKKIVAVFQSFSMRK
jgi:hypothetical protein